MMIDLNNYETWFLQYADGECSPAEQQAVETFLFLHPSLKEELAMMMEMRFIPGPISMPEKDSLRFTDLEVLNDQYRLEPDLAIVFPDKQSLYKRDKSRIVYLYRTLSAAAVLLFGIGLYWILSDEPIGKRIVMKPATIQPLSPSIQNATVTLALNNPATAKKKKKTTLPISGSVAASVIEQDINQNIDQNKEAILYKDVIAQVQDPLPTQEKKKTVSNFSPEVLIAAAKRLEISNEASPSPTPLNTSVLIDDASKPAANRSLRTVVRTLSRRILHEDEQDDTKFIQVASFHIHVKN